MFEHVRFHNGHACHVCARSPCRDDATACTNASHSRCCFSNRPHLVHFPFVSILRAFLTRSKALSEYKAAGGPATGSGQSQTDTSFASGG